MKIAKTYAFYSAIILCFVTILITSVWFGKKTDEQHQIQIEQKNVFEHYQAVLKLESILIKKTVYDYSIWDELVEFIQTKETTWSKLNLEPILKTFNVDAVYVYAPDKTLVFSKTDNSLTSITPNLSTLNINKPLFQDFFQYDDKEFIQFFLAPIHASSDIERTGKPFGFLLLARKWDHTFLDSIAKITLGKTTLVPVNKSNTINSDSFSLPLQSLDNHTIGYISFSYTPSVLLFISDIQNYSAIAGFFIILLALFLFYLLTQRVLFKPIHYISMALRTHNLNYIHALSKQQHELGEIAELICEHEQQALLLEHYKEAIDESTIVSKTNPQGIITYANEQFVAISGYAKEELVGKPHNIIRHPDNPPSFFKEIWNTLHDGKTWKGIVKNRRKDGSSYYVKSVIMPLMDAEGNIEEYIAIRYDITELFEQVEHLRKETFAELPSRKTLLESIEHAHNPHLAILNICGFRDINTLHGQHFGDLFLQQLAIKTKELLPVEFQLFHLQADEFAIFCDHILAYDIFTQECQNLMNTLNNEGLLVENKYYPLTLRIGIANGADYLYNRAEIALKEARNTHKFFVIYDDNEGFQKRLQQDIEWNQTLRDALINNRFTIFLQEIVPLFKSASKRKKYEVLIRLIDVNGRIISPFHFIDLAKRMHIYHQLTRFVIQEGIRAAFELNCDISINITKEDILNQETTTFLLNTLHQYALLKNRITLELVESEGIEDSKEVQTFLQTVRSHGCLLAIDDFGAGYSNFEYLLRLNVDFIKIDGSLIKNLDTDDNALATVKAITHFAKNLGVAIVAEFVHKKEILDIVKELGIDYAQGFYLHEPAPKPKLK